MNAIELPVPKALTLGEEIAFARMVVARAPNSPMNASRLAHLLLMDDKFDEAAELLRLDGHETDDPSDLSLLYAAAIARETPAGNVAARDCATRAVAAAGNNAEKAQALANLGKTHARLSDIAAARTALLEALELDPANKDAFKRITALDLEAGNTVAALDRADRAIALGITHSRVLAARVLALAKLGRIEESRAASGIEAGLARRFPGAPEGWATLEAFNAALAEEFANHPGTRFDRYGAASERTWRIDNPLLTRSKVAPALFEMIAREVEAHIDELASQPGAASDPWRKGRPSRLRMHGWCVMVDGDGFETWHVHQFGWLSGVYYADIPDFIANGEDNGGCLAHGLPEDLVGADRQAEFGQKIFRPTTGDLLLFPSHLYHRTFPHRGDRRRVCFAFDIRPAQSGEA